MYTDRYPCGEVWCIRIVTLAATFPELLPFVDFSCPEHSLKPIVGMQLIFCIQIDIIGEKNGAYELLLKLHIS